MRLFKITLLLLLIFSGGIASGGKSARSFVEQKSAKHKIVNEALTKSPCNPYNYECIVNSIPVQVNVQQHRSLHFWQVVNSSANGYTVTIGYIDLICGSGANKLSYFRKLILFPFHVFW